MKEAAAALIVGDVSRPNTLDTMVKLATGFTESFPGRHTTFIVNKTDLIPDAELAPLPAALTQKGATLVRASAKTGSNVANAFIETADVIARRGH
jgi:50S ribosomal subunit-associated GTPase HflX